MKWKSYVALLCAAALAAPVPAQSVFVRVADPYRAAQKRPNDLANSKRLEALMRAGNLYLSLQDAIALALENNLDIAIQRYTPLLADTSVEMAEAGGFARGVSTNVTAGPNSASVSSAGTTASTQSATAASSTASASAVGGSVVQSSGPAIPSLDPMLSAGFNWSHQTTAQSSAFVT